MSKKKDTFIDPWHTLYITQSINTPRKIKDKAHNKIKKIVVNVTRILEKSQCMCTSILDGGDNKKGEREVEEQKCMYFFIKLLSSDSNMPLDKFFHQIQRTCLKAFGHIPID